MRRSLFLQIGLSITVFIFLIEGILQVFSVQNRKQELYELRRTLEMDIAKGTSSKYETIHPNILSEADIERRMEQYKINIILLTMLISVVVVIGTLAVFHFVAGKHIVQLATKNRNGNLPQQLFMI